MWRRLSAELGVPVVPTVAVKRGGADALIEAIETGALDRRSAPWPRRRGTRPPPKTPSRCSAICADLLAAAGYSPPRESPGSGASMRCCCIRSAASLVLLAVLFVMFQAVFSWAEAPMDWIDGGMSALGEFTAAHMPAGPLASLLVNGVIGGAGSVLVFLPQILILFFFILALEDSGYLPRAAYLLDRLMGRRRAVGPRLHPAAVELRLRDPRHHGGRAPSRAGATA